MPRRQHITLLTIVGVFALLAIFFVSIFRNQAEGTRHPDNLYNGPNGGLKIDDGILHGEATAPKLENATLKYALWGNAMNVC
jgi:FAD-linked sulfhydryl oxidase